MESHLLIMGDYHYTLLRDSLCRLPSLAFYLVLVDCGVESAAKL
jgi:hypothetical protein